MSNSKTCNGNNNNKCCLEKNTSVTHVTEHIVTHVTYFDTVFIPKILTEINDCMLI